MIVTMTTTAAFPTRSTRSTRTTAAEQLSLLPEPTAAARFRLSRDTRERGLRHVAEIRRMLADRSAAQPAERSEVTHPAPQRSRAA
jgi:hypothetical protein